MPSICVIIRPAGLVVLMFSVMDRKSGAGAADALHMYLKAPEVMTSGAWDAGVSHAGSRPGTGQQMLQELVLLLQPA